MVEKKIGTGFQDFFCVAADEQTAAKAQGNKTWLSNKGENILVSFYFQPPLLPPQQIYFNYFFALTIRETLSLFVDHVMIKKPNDIYVEDKKIAGILIEHHIQGEKLNYTVAGVGININQTQFDASLPNPVSLKLITGSTFNREMILEQLVKFGKEYYHLLQKGAFTELENEFLLKVFLTQQ
jgi:BirA family biotin operon repressor/biotin-[acetyl-CoA-carboxylase] ligase